MLERLAVHAVSNHPRRPKPGDEGLGITRLAGVSGTAQLTSYGSHIYISDQLHRVWCTECRRRQGRGSMPDRRSMGELLTI